MRGHRPHRGCLWRLADYQARVAALQISGRLRRPADIDERIRRETTPTRPRIDRSHRHAIEVDYLKFRRLLRREAGAADG